MQRALRTWGTPITLILLLALLGYGAWWGWNSLTRPPAPVTPDPCVSQSMETLKSTQVTVRVYNGGGKTGLAGSTAAVLRTKGFKVPVVDNTEEVITNKHGLKILAKFLGADRVLFRKLLHGLRRPEFQTKSEHVGGGFIQTE